MASYSMKLHSIYSIYSRVNLLNLRIILFHGRFYEYFESPPPLSTPLLINRNPFILEALQITLRKLFKKKSSLPNKSQLDFPKLIPNLLPTPGIESHCVLFNLCALPTQ